MKDNGVNRLVIAYLLVIGLVYVPTVGLWGNIAALRALHLDIPSFASDAAFQTKALVNFLAGVVMLSGCVGLFTRQRWGKPITVAGLVCQMAIYVVELAIFRYLPTAASAVVVILLDVAIIYGLTRSPNTNQAGGVK